MDLIRILVRDWSLRRCTVGSRHLEPSRDMIKVRVIGSSSLSGIENKGPKIREENGVYHISTFVFLFIRCTF